MTQYTTGRISAPCGCIPGFFLCKDAEYEWSRSGAAHFARAYKESDKWRQRYREHITKAEAAIAKSSETAKP